MQIAIDTSSIKQTTWGEYAARFVMGGTVTAAAGLIARHFGPSVGGLFLAFPAIFPASATLIEKHEKEKKEAAGLNGTNQARRAASVDAAGSSMGAWGLLVFGLLFWQLEPGYNSAFVLLLATLSWLMVSIVIWHIRR